jgi:transposase InsO family protein
MSCVSMASGLPRTRIGLPTSGRPRSVLAFVVDVFSRMVVRWQASRSLRSDLAIDALVESFNGLYKWELLYKQGPWRGLDDVEFATMTYVDWFNHRRLHGQITNDASYATPAEHETRFYNQTPMTKTVVAQ